MLRHGLIGAIRFYQHAVSPLMRPCCRFTPTCSKYAVEAIEEFGALSGGWLAFRRILRCRPFGGQVYDPVPKAEVGDMVAAESFVPNTYAQHVHSRELKSKAKI